MHPRLRDPPPQPAVAARRRWLAWPWVNGCRRPLGVVGIVRYQDSALCGRSASRVGQGRQPSAPPQGTPSRASRSTCAALSSGPDPGDLAPTRPTSGERWPPRGTDRGRVTAFQRPHHTGAARTRREVVQRRSAVRPGARSAAVVCGTHAGIVPWTSTGACAKVGRVQTLANGASGCTIAGGGGRMRPPPRGPLRHRPAVGEVAHPAATTSRMAEVRARGPSPAAPRRRRVRRRWNTTPVQEEGARR